MLLSQLPASIIPLLLSATPIVARTVRLPVGHHHHPRNVLSTIDTAVPAPQSSVPAKDRLLQDVQLLDETVTAIPADLLAFMRETADRIDQIENLLASLLEPSSSPSSSSAPSFSRTRIALPTAWEPELPSITPALSTRTYPLPSVIVNRTGSTSSEDGMITSTHRTIFRVTRTSTVWVTPVSAAPTQTTNSTLPPYPLTNSTGSTNITSNTDTDSTFPTFPPLPPRPPLGASPPTHIPIDSSGTTTFNPSNPSLSSDALNFLCTINTTRSISIPLLRLPCLSNPSPSIFNRLNPAICTFATGAALPDCSYLIPALQTCKANNKTLHIGVAPAEDTAVPLFPPVNYPPELAEADAQGFWDFFGPGDGMGRPFGDVVVDGVDLRGLQDALDNPGASTGALGEYLRDFANGMLKVAAMEGDTGAFGVVLRGWMKS
ncbi:glycoside hydrolase family 18 protein [Patellaria atrata CBS 101060]|uniref:Glycoside hydrolase family 18 protein n=1 Tax=Patellaria atrata CBS 101060 TaxID=1346257 RepID=A0A9P4SBB2_9PEZI|nr:glycoside hydrolase family 18 protein [Patellaria atrata CBS 101060]